MKNEKKKLPSITPLPLRPKLTLSKNLMTQIDYYHNHIGKVEWSGILFYKKVEGDFSNIESLSFVAERMLLMDIGTSASTDFDYDESLIDFLDEYPELENYEMGLIHTHHNLSSSNFSSTDLEELQENTQNHNYYVSLIAHFSWDVSAKLAVNATGAKTSVNIKDENGKEIETSIEQKEDSIVTFDMKIFFELDNYDVTRLSEVRKISAEKKTTVRGFYSGGKTVGGNRSHTAHYPHTMRRFDHDDKIKEFNEKKYKEFVCGLIELKPNVGHVDVTKSLSEAKKKHSKDLEKYKELIEDKLETFVNLYVGTPTKRTVSDVSMYMLERMSTCFDDFPELTSAISEVVAYYCADDGLQDQLQEEYEQLMLSGY